ncbi:unnamed protein product, partial [Ilex paraguariensis]
ARSWALSCKWVLASRARGVDGKVQVGTEVVGSGGDDGRNDVARCPQRCKHRSKVAIDDDGSK